MTVPERLEKSPIDRNKIARIKAATVGLGFAEHDEAVPKLVCGTGFFISDDGIIMTAAHVKRYLVQQEAFFKQSGQKLTAVAFSVISDSNGVMLMAYNLRQAADVMHLDPPPGTIIPPDFDVSVIKVSPSKPGVKFPFLPIRKPSKLELYEDVAICGYPAGNQTLNFNKEYFSGVRLSPVVQFGKIVSIMPYDEARVPNAIQTDIFSTGGSSGSAIVGIGTGDVVGIAQQVIGAEVVGSDRRLIAKVGAVYGITNQILFGIAAESRMMLEQPGYQPKFTFDATRFPSMKKFRF